jgi:MraZ protein
MNEAKTLLSGTYIYGMDRKGRVVMPAQFRNQLGAPFVLTRAPGQCLLALSAPQWDTLLSRYENSVLFRGYYLSAAVECPVDETTGRFLIPHVLRDYAELRPMDEVAISGIGRAVQVARRQRWEHHLQTGEFPSLGQLDLDLDVPRPVETQPYRQEIRRPMGLPVVQCRGRMHGRAVRRLASTVLKLILERPPVIVLDVRDTGETQMAMQGALSLTRLQRADHNVPLWVVSETELPGDEWTTYFPNLEEVLWRLEDLRPRPRRRTRRTPTSSTDSPSDSDLLPDVEGIEL